MKWPQMSLDVTKWHVKFQIFFGGTPPNPPMRGGTPPSRTLPPARLWRASWPSASLVSALFSTWGKHCLPTREVTSVIWLVEGRQGQGVKISENCRQVVRASRDVTAEDGPDLVRMVHLYNMVYVELGNWPSSAHYLGSSPGYDDIIMK